MGRHRTRIAAGLRRRFGRSRRTSAPPQPPPKPLRGLGEPPAASVPDQAGEAELDTLRGELVRELDRLAEGEPGSASFRRIAS